MQTFVLDSSFDATVNATLTADAERLARGRISRLAPILQAKLVDAALERGVVADSVPSDRGAFLAKQLEFIQAEVKEVTRAKLTALDLFPINSSIPAGAQKWTQRRKAGSAKMVYHSGGQGSAPPVASMEVWEESFPILTAVTGLRYSIFDLLHSDFAGIGLKQELTRIMTRGVDEFLNANAWFGDTANGARGVLNNLLCSRRFGSVVYATANGDVILADMQAQFNLFNVRAKGTGLKPNRCALPPALLNVMKQKLSVYHAQTIMEAFLQANPELSKDTFVEAHELDGAGPGGQDVIFWYNTSEDSVSHVLPRGLTMLPAQMDGFEVAIPGYIRYGGVKMDEPLMNLISFIPKS